MGFAPVSNPRVVVVVTANGASGRAGFGAEVSAPVFKEVATTALRMLDVPPDVPDDAPLPDATPVDTNDLAIADVGALPDLTPDDDETANGAPDASVQLGPKVPDFAGMTMKAVAEQSSALGIPVEFVGSGIVRRQSPLPGRVLPSGERVRVQFRP